MKTFWIRSIPNLLVFISSLCMMIIELVASRLIARGVGQSLYTWTSVIGVVLGGMCVGNWLGGKLADRYPPRKTVAWLFMIASALCLAIIYMNFLSNRWIASNNDQTSALFIQSWPLRVMITVSLTFFLPAMALGTISPVVAKMALDVSEQTGTAIGNVYAWGALGSILGTFLAGYLLIGALGTKAIVLVVAALLAVVGVILGTTLHAVWAGISLGVCILAFAPWPWAVATGRRYMVRQVRGLWEAQGLTPEERWEGDDEKAGTREMTVYTNESNYNFIKVTETIPRDGRSLPFRTLVLDNLQHGYVYHGHPEKFQYQYESIYATITRRAAPAAKGLSVLFIGGGSYTYPRYIEHTYPDSTIEVAEIDPAVERAAHEALWLPATTSIHTRIGDARNTIDDDLRTGRRYDFVYGDAFNHFSVPWHLTTREFDDKIKGLLTPRGVYLINIIDIFPTSLAPKGVGRFLGAFVHTAEDCFGPGHVAVFSTAAKPPSESAKSSRQTFVVACSRAPLDLDQLGRRTGEIPLAGVRLSDKEIALLRATAGGMTLTDDYAPVDNLLAPVICDRARDFDKTQ